MRAYPSVYKLQGLGHLFFLLLTHFRSLLCISSNRVIALLSESSYCLYLQ
jgi:hypothetical protein